LPVFVLTLIFAQISSVWPEILFLIGANCVPYRICSRKRSGDGVYSKMKRYSYETFR
jgi:hypothetical protein